MLANVYVDLEYTFPKTTTLPVKRRLPAFAGYLLLKLLVYTLAFHSSLLIFHQPSMKQVFMVECVVVLVVKYVFALTIRSKYKYELVVMELPVLIISCLPVFWYCWGHWGWIGPAFSAGGSWFINPPSFLQNKSSSPSPPIHRPHSPASGRGPVSQNQPFCLLLYYLPLALRSQP